MVCCYGAGEWDAHDVAWPELVQCAAGSPVAPSHSEVGQPCLRPHFLLAALPSKTNPLHVTTLFSRVSLVSPSESAVSLNGELPGWQKALEFDSNIGHTGKQGKKSCLRTITVYYSR